MVEKLQRSAPSWIAGAFVTGALVGCTEASATLTVRIQTDLAPGTEVGWAEAAFVQGSACARIRDGFRGRPVTRADQAALGAGTLTVATFEGLRPGVYSVVGRVRRARSTGAPEGGEEVMSRCVIVSVDASRVVRVSLTTNCVSVRCPDPSGSSTRTSCVNGRCVDPRCDPDDPVARGFCCADEESCGPTSVLCESSEDCPRGPSCRGAPQCVEGLCFAAEDDACPDGQHCDSRTSSCVDDPAPLEADAGTSDAADASLDALESPDALEAPDSPLLEPLDAAAVDAREAADAWSLDSGWTCPEGRRDCDLDPSNGCETDVETSLAHCGACNLPCEGFGARWSCIDGACRVLDCEPGRGDCNASDADGCETDVSTTTAHCGRCGNTCPSRANATSSCTSGSCGFTCNSGWGNCDGSDANGCEVSVATSATHCGACNEACFLRPNASPTCAGGSCGLGCASGYGDCDGVSPNGCEALLASTSHCGSCRRSCASGQGCVAGTCARVFVVRAGARHACARFADGTISCWGRNENGQVGDGTTMDRSTPTPVTLPGTATFHALGNHHGCAVLSDGRLMCWGRNHEGQLGDGTTVDRRSPVLVVGLPGAVVGVAAGSAHTCALVADGTVHCWGNNAFGQLGDGTTTSRRTPGAVTGLSGVTSIAAANNHTCALRSDRTVWCWGANERGQVGDGSTRNRLRPVEVSALHNAVSLDLGQRHSCATLLDGTVRCWGNNAFGQLGDGTTMMRFFHVAVSGLAEAVEVSASDKHTCARRLDGTVRCWGNNAGGQLGNGTTTSSPVPVGVAGLTAAESIAAGGDGSVLGFTCASLGGGLACWGGDDSGVLALGASTNQNHTLPTSATRRPTSLAPGGSHTCALLGTGEVRCWGNNAFGQLGDGTFTSRPRPGSVAGLSGTPVQVASGRDHSCAVRTDGRVMCWGHNGSGQLGDGSMTHRAAPVLVPGVTSAVSLALGGEHSCALGSDGRVRCWGRNDAGQLGSGMMGGTSTAAVEVVGLTNVVAIGAGDLHTCALTSAREVRCWGRNASGQLGNGTTVDSATPVAVSSLSNVVGLAVGEQHSCAVLGGGSVRCWGRNASGQLGNGTTVDSSTPVSVTGPSSVVWLDAGSAHTCAVLSSPTGSVRCWGSNIAGELGDGTSTSSSTPRSSSLPGLGLALGARHSCGISGFEMRCSGYNIEGQLGDGTTLDRISPVSVVGL